MWYWDPSDIYKKGPGAFSWFHFLWLGVLIISLFLIIHFLAKKHDRKIELLVTRIFAIVLVTAEITKQIIVCIIYSRYRFNSFPFEICSIPMYTILISSFISNYESKFKIVMDKTSVLIGFVGGLATLIYPVCLNTSVVLKSIHSMFYHVLICAYAVYLYISKEWYKYHNIKHIFVPLGIFVASCFMAIIINEIVYYTYIGPNNLDVGSHWIDRCNMFFLSYKYKCSLPVLNLIQGKVPYLIFVLIYIVLISSLFIIVYYLASGIYKIIEKKRTHSKTVK